MIRFALLTAIFLGSTTAVAATPQRAESAKGASSKREFGAYTYSREESDREFATYSECLIGNASGERQAAAFLRMVPDGAAWNEAGRKLSTPQCLGRSFVQVKLRFSLTALRPALFAAMYRRKFGKVVPASFNDDPPLSLDRMYDGQLSGFPAAAFAQLNFGNCVARADTAAVHRLLLAKPWSDAEDAALPAVSQAMGRCLNEGQTLHLNRSGVRNVLAEAMYQLSTARAAGSRVAAVTEVR